MPIVFSLWVAVCCTLELAQPSQAQGPATFLGTADERLLVLRMGIWPNRRVGPSYYEKIRPGMTEGDVAKVLGCPSVSRDDSKGTEWKMISTPKGMQEVHVMKINTWVGLDQVVVIDFGEKGTVVRRELVSLEQWAYEKHFDTRNDFKKLRAWLQHEP